MDLNAKNFYVPAIELSNGEFNNLMAHAESMPQCRLGLPLFYAGHIPIVTYLLCEGYVNFFDENQKLSCRVGQGHILGFIELHHNRSSALTAQAMPNTSLGYLDKSTINQLITSKTRSGQILENYLNCFASFSLENV